MLSERNIEDELGKGINVHPFREKNIKENSINLTVSQYAWTMGKGSVMYKRGGEFILAQGSSGHNVHSFNKGDSAIVKRDGKRYLVLLPHATTLVETEEVLGVSNYIGGTLHSKVGVVAQGIGDIGTMLGPNFCGHLMISLHNITDNVIVMNVGESFVSMIFYYLDKSSKQDRNAHCSGHVDKLAELGVKITKAEREAITEDWKYRIDKIRNRMNDSSEYRNFRERLKKENRSRVWKYFTVRNFIIILVILAVMIFAAKGAAYYDSLNGNNTWTERYWTVLISTIIVPGALAVKKLFNLKE